MNAGLALLECFLLNVSTGQYWARDEMRRYHLVGVLVRTLIFTPQHNQQSGSRRGSRCSENREDGSAIFPNV